MAFSFKGLKFYVSIHTPNETKKIIQNNGGIVVANENDADIRIRDPSRGPPSYRSGDYYSHKWIVDCIKQKRQVDEAPYLIQRQAHPSTTPARPARPARNERTEGERERSPPQREEEDGLVYASARSQSVVKTRNAFTREDDRILQDWVIQKATRAIEEDEYFHDRGNEMYKKLEEKYPHHTYQSWRDRWVKKLSLTTRVPVARIQERPQKKPRESSRKGEEVRAQMENGPDSERRPPRERPQEPPQEPPQDLPQEPQQEPPQEPPQEPLQEPPQEQRRNEARDQAQKDEMLDDSSGRPGELFFMDYTDYYILSKAYSFWKDEKRKSGTHAKPTNSFFEYLHSKFPDISLNELRSRYYRLRNMYTKGDAAPAAAPSTIPQSQTQNGTSNGEQGNPQEDTEEIDGGDDGLDLDDDAILNGVGDHDNQQQVFQKCLDEYNDYLGVYVPPSFFIGGRFLDTYSLWTALQDAADDGDRINWDSVVETLGLDSTKYTLLASQLAAWYDFNLKEFRSFWIRYKEVTEASGSDEEGEDEEGGEEDEGEEGNGEAEAAEADAQTPSGNPAPGSASRSRGLVDVVRGFFRSSEAHPDAPAPESPSKHVRFSGAEAEAGAGDVGGDGDEEEDSDDEDDDEDDFQSRRVTRSGARQRTPTKTRTVEPETQDFAFGNETQAPTDLGGDGENEDDEGNFDDEVDAQMRGAPGKATPTRQLRSEDRAVASVPRSLPAPGSTKRKRTAAAPSAASPSKRQQRKSTA